jgi:hypothetical protein
MTTLHPAWAKDPAIPVPIPLVEPVMMAVFECNMDLSLDILMNMV